MKSFIKFIFWESKLWRDESESDWEIRPFQETLTPGFYSYRIYSIDWLSSAGDKLSSALLNCKWLDIFFFR